MSERFETKNQIYHKTKMMKKIILILFFTLAKVLVFGQDFEGVSDGNYKILLQIDKDSSVNFIYSYNQEMYAEYKGKVHKADDSLYHITATMIFGNNLVFSPYTMIVEPPFTVNDTVGLMVDTPFVDLSDTVIIRYSNGQTVNYVPFDKYGNKAGFILNKKLLNEHKGSDYYTFILKRKNKITGKPLVFKIGIHSAFGVITGDVIDFDVKISNNKLWTINGFKLQTRDFRLKKKSTH
jgi:hypothetical protein